MKRQPSLLSVAYNLPSSSSATIIHSPNSLCRKYKPLTRDSIIPDASVSTTYIRQGKERKNGKRMWERKNGGVKLSTMPEWQDRRKPGNGSIQIPVGADVRRSVSNVILVGYVLRSEIMMRMNHGMGNWKSPSQVLSNRAVLYWGWKWLLISTVRRKSRSNTHHLTYSRSNFTTITETDYGAPWLDSLGQKVRHGHNV